VSPLFLELKNKVLGKKYDLSVAFLSPAKMGAITLKTLKKKNHVSNVLSFPLSKTSGEILICKSAAKPFTVDFLFIHGLFHLKGLKHGATMENEERKLLKSFGLSQYANDNGNRRRNVPRKSGNSRVRG
jgi:ssRNA-specific RNase YbeY (16S rRNA maturation enzyme)